MKETTLLAPRLGEGPVVRLRRWKESDLPRYREWLQPHQEWHFWDGPYYDRPTSEAIDYMVNRLEGCIRDWDGVDWSLVDKQPTDTFPVQGAVVADSETDEFVGIVNWYWESQATEWARLGITVFDPGQRGSGRGTEALRLWTDYLFSNTNWRRLDYATWSGNSAMLRVGAKLGFQEEARFRQARVVRGEIYDSVVMGVLRSEWV